VHGYHLEANQCATDWRNSSMVYYHIPKSDPFHECCANIGNYDKDIGDLNIYGINNRCDQSAKKPAGCSAADEKQVDTLFGLPAGVKLTQEEIMMDVVSMGETGTPAGPQDKLFGLGSCGAISDKKDGPGFYLNQDSVRKAIHARSLKEQPIWNQCAARARRARSRRGNRGTKGNRTHSSSGRNRGTGGSSATHTPSGQPSPPGPTPTAKNPNAHVTNQQKKAVPNVTKPSCPSPRRRSSYKWPMLPMYLSYKRTTKNLIAVYPKLLRAGVRVLIFSGDVDACVPYIGTEAWTTSLAKSEGFKTTSPWAPWIADQQVRTRIPAVDPLSNLCCSS